MNPIDKPIPNGLYNPAQLTIHCPKEAEKENKKMKYDREQLIARGICEVCTVEDAVFQVRLAKEETSWAKGMGACPDCYPQVAEDI